MGVENETCDFVADVRFEFDEPVDRRASVMPLSRKINSEQRA